MTNAHAMIHLVGPGGAGKSTVGALLADRLGVAFIDLDTVIDVVAGDSDLADCPPGQAESLSNPGGRRSDRARDWLTSLLAPRI
jgi:shikimate kinase